MFVVFAFSFLDMERRLFWWEDVMLLVFIGLANSNSGSMQDSRLRDSEGIRK